jgi:hypothetical protein
VAPDGAGAGAGPAALASPSALEALMNQMNWLRTPLRRTSMGRALIRVRARLTPPDDCSFSGAFFGVGLVATASFCISRSRKRCGPGARWPCGRRADL